MGSNTDTKQVMLPNVLLNDINTPDVESTFTSPTGSPGRFEGFLGVIITMDNDDAYKHSDITNIGTLYHGRYQCIQLISTSAASLRGQAAFWPTASLSAQLAPSRYQVTASVTNGQQAGVFINALTPGNYGWIQLDGLCTVQWAGTLTAGTPAVGDLVYVSTATGQTSCFDVPENTTMTDAILKRLVGLVEGTPPSEANYGFTYGTAEFFPRIKNW